MEVDQLLQDAAQSMVQRTQRLLAAACEQCPADGNPVSLPRRDLSCFVCSVAQFHTQTRNCVTCYSFLVQANQ